MSKQHADDPGLHIRAVWLGPPSSWRWPFDATFTEWRIGFALFAASTALLWLIVPAAVPTLALAWFVSSFTIRALLPDGGIWPRLGMVASWAFIALLALPDPLAWLTPMPLALAALLSPLLAALIVRRVGRYVTPERPVAYWLALLPRVAAGPRQHQPERIDPTTLLLQPGQPYNRVRIEDPMEAI